MTDEDFKGLNVGDLIMHKHGRGEGLIVTANYGDHVVAVRTYHVSNPPEWDLVRKARYTQVSVPSPDVKPLPPAPIKKGG